WDSVMRQGRASEHEHQVQADSECGVRFSQLNCLRDGALVDHQTGAGQHAFAVRLNDGAVDRFGITEVIAVDDERRQGWRVKRGGTWVIGHSVKYALQSLRVRPQLT